MNGCLRIHVLKCNGVLIFIEDLRRHILVDDLAEYAVLLHVHFLPPSESEKARKKQVREPV
jgi:hypothetical protein